MTIEELRDFNYETEKNARNVRYHTNQAVNFKRIYELTKNRKGIYRLLNIFAEKRNRYHYKKRNGIRHSSIEIYEQSF